MDMMQRPFCERVERSGFPDELVLQQGELAPTELLDHAVDSATSVDALLFAPCIRPGTARIRERNETLGGRSREGM